MQPRDHDPIRQPARRHALPLALLVVFIASACGQGAAPSTGPTSTPGVSRSPAPSATVTAPVAIDLARADVPRASADPAAAQTAADSINAFGFDLYRAVAAASPNAVFSPTSIALALAMARAGAATQTAAQMDRVLHSGGLQQQEAGLDALDQALTSRNQTVRIDDTDLPIALRIANAPFAQRDMPLETPYLEALATWFGAGVQLVDYERDTEAARLAINGWVDGQTEHRIPELLARGVITPDTRLTLVNAIYLKAPWQIPFLPEATAPAPFTRADGSKVSVPTMAEAMTLGYGAGPGWRAVELPYLGGQLALTIVVPDELSVFERALDAAAFDRITGSLTAHEVDVALPKFSVKAATDLATQLTGLGMPQAFDPDHADFSGITSRERLFITNVVHQANIDVDEKGTTAAAATAVSMAASAAPAGRVTFRIDRPFVFAVRDVPTGAILFLGRVTDPSVAP
jgi:serine protease inhibitor